MKKLLLLNIEFNVPMGKIKRITNYVWAKYKNGKVKISQKNIEDIYYNNFRKSMPKNTYYTIK
jgi:ribosomal protein S9|tara:strand:- start:372 stop:560 length:189 start_codon:yes stop_codon:yes gene_type:complete